MCGETETPFGTVTMVMVGVQVEGMRESSVAKLTLAQKLLYLSDDSVWTDAENTEILGFTVYENDEPEMHLLEAQPAPIGCLTNEIVAVRQQLLDEYGLEAHAYIVRFEYTNGVDWQDWPDQLIGIPTCALV